MAWLSWIAAHAAAAIAGKHAKNKVPIFLPKELPGLTGIHANSNAETSVDPAPSNVTSAKK